MSAKLQLTKQLISPVAIQEAWMFLQPCRLRSKIRVLASIYCDQDEGMSRKEFAESHCISARTLQRWIHEFNAKGLHRIVGSPPGRPGRKPTVSGNDLQSVILPAAEQAVKEAGGQASMKTLFQSAQKLGLFPGSYATFRRSLGPSRDNYMKPRIQPTVEELVVFQLTGRWPARLKAFGRRRAKQERQAWQKIRDEFHLECKKCGADGMSDIISNSLQTPSPTLTPLDNTRR